MISKTKNFFPVPDGKNYCEISENYHEAFPSGYMIIIDDIKEHLRVEN